MTPPDSPRPARHRSRPEIGLIVLYSAVALSLLGSIGAGLTLTGEGDGLITRGDLQQVVLASR